MANAIKGFCLAEKGPVRPLGRGLQGVSGVMGFVRPLGLRMDRFNLALSPSG
jgi:hypothetical protein